MWEYSETGMLIAASPFIVSATAESSDSSGAAEADGHPALGDDYRHLALSLAVVQHFRHAAGIGFDIVVEVFGIRLTGAVGVGSALFSVDDNVHVSSLDLW